MLRPASSRILISSEDIQDLRNRLANRSTHRDFISRISRSDCHATTATSSSQNHNPLPWQKSLLRPGPRRFVDDAFVIFDGHNHSTPPGSPSTGWPGDIYAAAEIDGQRYNEYEGEADVATDLAIARHIIDEAANSANNQRVDPGLSQVRQRTDEATWTAGMIPHITSTSEDINNANTLSVHISPGFVDHASPISRAERQVDIGTLPRQELQQSHDLDGTSERIRPYQRGGESEDPFSVSSITGPGLPDEHGLPDFPMRGVRNQSLIARSLDPLAPSFVPTTRLGSADDQEGRNSISSSTFDHRARYLQPRPHSSANTDNCQQVSRTAQLRVHGRHSPLRGRPNSHPQPRLRGGDQEAPYLPPSGTRPVQDRNPVLGNLPQASLSVRPHDPNRVVDERQGLSGRVAPPLPQYPTRSHPRRDADNESRISSWSQVYPLTHTTAHSSFSVPDLVNSAASRTPVIQSRRSSLTWSRNAPDDSAIVHSRFSSGMSSVGSSKTHVEVHSARYFVRNTAPSQAFYLNNSPLDELSDGLRRFSGASSARRSSGGSNPLRPFHGKLLSGSLFYSEDIYSEEPQSAGEPEQVDGETTSSSRRSMELHLPPPAAPYYHRTCRSGTPTATHPSTLSPRSATNLPRALVPGPLKAPVNRSGCSAEAELACSSPLPIPFRRSNSSHSPPISSMPQIELSPSSPVRATSSDPPYPSPKASLSSTPCRRRGHHSEKNAIRSEPRPRPAATPRFRIYNDGLPATTQPQTPADLARRPQPPASVPYKTASIYGRAPSPSPMTSNQRDTYLATQLRPIFEPSTAELTMIPFVSPLQPARQTRAHPRRRRGNRPPSEDQENEIDISALAGLEGERIAWLRRSTGSDFTMREPGGHEVLEDTPPHLGRFERMARE